MKRIITIASMLLISIISAEAGGKGSCSSFVYGVEWSYVASIFSGCHYNFFAEDGYRVDHRDNGFAYESNGEFLLKAGIDLNDAWNLSLYTGYTVIHDMHRSIPISIRATRFFRSDNHGDRWFAFVDAGSGISIKKEPQETVTGKVGGGYRVEMSRRVKLDFIGSIRINYTHCDIYDGDYRIEMKDVNRNNAYACGLTLGMALTF